MNLKKADTWFNLLNSPAAISVSATVIAFLFAGLMIKSHHSASEVETLLEVTPKEVKAEILERLSVTPRDVLLHIIEVEKKIDLLEEEVKHIEESLRKFIEDHDATEGTSATLEWRSSWEEAVREVFEL